MRDVRATQIKHERQAKREEKALLAVYVDDARRFAERTPDFRSVYELALLSRCEELAASNENVDLRKLFATVNAKEREIVAAALRLGVSPAERVYAACKEQLQKKSLS